MNTPCRKRAVQVLCAVTVLPWSAVAASRLHSSSQTSYIHRTVSTTSRPTSQTAFVSTTTSRSSSSIHKRTRLFSTPTDQPQSVMQVKNRIALLQFHTTPSKSQNISTARQNILAASKAGARLCVLPECWNSPYATAAFPEYAESLPNTGDDCTNSESAKMLMEMAKSTNMYIVGGSVPEISSGKLYNTCLVIDPLGVVVGKHRKVHLFDVDVPGGIRFRESETLCAGDGVTYFDVDAGEGGLGRIGVGICYDIRFPEYALLLTQIHKCKILIYPGAFNLTTGPAHWELLQRARAVDGQCYVLTASPARAPPPEEEGKYPHYSAWGHSTAVSPWGEVIGTCDEKPNVVMVDLDMTKVEEMRMAIPTCIQKRHDLYRLFDGSGETGV